MKGVTGRQLAGHRKLREGFFSSVLDLKMRGDLAYLFSQEKGALLACGS